MTTRAVGEGDSDGEPTAYRLRGRKAWISHAGHADYYTTFARTSDDGGRGLSCFVVPADAPGLSFGTPEKKMGLHCDTVREVMYDDVPVDGARRIGAEGQGMAIALSALDAGRLGIAAAATGLAQSALDLAASYAQGAPAVRARRSRRTRGSRSSSPTWRPPSPAPAPPTCTRRGSRMPGAPFSKEAAVAKLVATDAAMKVTTDAVQVLGGAGYTQDFPAERFMREAKVTQIFEGTNQIQRLVISRHVLALTPEASPRRHADPVTLAAILGPRRPRSTDAHRTTASPPRWPPWSSARARAPSGDDPEAGRPHRLRQTPTGATGGAGRERHGIPLALVGRQRRPARRPAHPPGRGRRHRRHRQAREGATPTRSSSRRGAR